MPSQAPWYQGAEVPLTWVNTDSGGDPQDGDLSTVSLTVTLPDRSTATPDVTRNGPGDYSASYLSEQAGHHVILWHCADPDFPGAYADSFEVDPAADPTIVSLAEAKEILGLSADDSQDLVLRGYNAAATEVVEYMCGPVVTRQLTEVVRAQGRVLILSNAPVRTDLGTPLDPAGRRDGSTTNGLVSLTPLLSYGFMYDLDQLNVDGPRGIVRHNAGLPFFYSGDPYSQFEAVYWTGRAVIPAVIYEGAKIILEHLYQVKRGGVGAQDVASGESVTTLTGFGYAVPNRALELLSSAAGSASRAAFA